VRERSERRRGNGEGRGAKGEKEASEFCTVGGMGRYQISLMSVLLLGGGLPIWLALILLVPGSTGWGGNPARFVMAPLVLTGMTVALHRLFAKYRDGWAIAILVAAVIAWCSLWVAFLLSRFDG
jgi:hypothetical protein